MKVDGKRVRRMSRRTERALAAQLCIAVERWVYKDHVDEAVRADLHRKMATSADMFRNGRTTDRMKRGKR